VNYTGVERWGIKNKNMKYNLSVPELYERAIRKPVEADFNTLDTCISSTGALCSYSGLRTGRSPKDKRTVLDESTKDVVWWGEVNKPMTTEANRFCRELAVKYLNTT